MTTSRTGTALWRNIARQRRKIAQDQGQETCPLCGVVLNWDEPRQPNSVEVDHIVEHWRGGPDRLWNTRVVCRQCNVGRNRSLPRKRKDGHAGRARAMIVPIVDYSSRW